MPPPRGCGDLVVLHGRAAEPRGPEPRKRHLIRPFLPKFTAAQVRLRPVGQSKLAQPPYPYACYEPRMHTCVCLRLHYLVFRCPTGIPKRFHFTTWHAYKPSLLRAIKTCCHSSLRVRERARTTKWDCTPSSTSFAGDKAEGKALRRKRLVRLLFVDYPTYE